MTNRTYSSIMENPSGSFSSNLLKNSEGFKPSASHIVSNDKIFGSFFAFSSLLIKDFWMSYSSARTLCDLFCLIRSSINTEAIVFETNSKYLLLVCCINRILCYNKFKGCLWIEP